MCYFQGMSPYTMGLTAHNTWKYPVAGPGAGIHHAMNPDVYRGLWGGPQHRDCPVLPGGVQQASQAECEAVAGQYLQQLEEVVRWQSGTF